MMYYYQWEQIPAASLYQETKEMNRIALFSVMFCVIVIVYNVQSTYNVNVTFAGSSVDAAFSIFLRLVSFA